MDQLKDTALSGSTPRLWPQMVELIVVAIAYWVAVRLGLLLVAHPEGVASIWPASGLALAVLLLSPQHKWTRMLTVIFVTNAAGNWTGGNSFLVSLGFALANTIEPFFSTWVLSYLCKSKISFNRTVEIFALFGVATLCNGITALLGAAVPALAFGAPFLNTWQLWWAADGLGIILVAPVIVTWVTKQNALNSISPRRMVETIVLIAMLAGLAWLLYGPFTVAEKPLLRNYMVFPLLIWLAFRFNQRGMASALLLFATIAIWNTLQGWGYFGFAAQNVTEHLTSVQMFLMVMTFSGLLLNAMVTEHKQAVVALRESEERFRRSFEGHSAVMLIIDPATGNIVDANASAVDFYGWSIEEIRKMRIQEINLLSPETVQSVIEEVESSNAIRFEFRHRRADGSIRDVEVYSNKIELTGKAHLYSIIHDITERKQGEEQKERLEAQNRQLQKSESLGVMAGAIAHHFNNQLGAVMGNLEMALEDLPRDAAPVKSLLTAAMQSAEKAAEVSGEMLMYLGQTTGIHTPLDLSETCRQSLPMLQTTAPKSITLTADLPSLGPTISANANQILQVLTNLATNAWEAIDENQGSIGLTVKMVSPADISAAHRFPIGWQQQDLTYACLEVTDTGCGIADEDIDKVFDPFFSSKFAGRGLGLPVVLGIVKAHDGIVTVESEVGQGSSFRVFLPVSAEEARQPAKTAQTLAREGSGTVLLVEDEEILRNMAATMLMRLGYTVLAAKDGVEAVEMFQKHLDEIRCVVSDLTMPRMNGWQTLAALRNLSPDIPVILSSGYNEAQVLLGDHPERPQVFLHKPYQKAALQEALAKAMEGE